MASVRQGSPAVLHVSSVVLTLESTHAWIASSLTMTRQRISFTAQTAAFAELGGVPSSSIAIHVDAAIQHP